jgi:hypothetical protein
VAREAAFHSPTAVQKTLSRPKLMRSACPSVAKSEWSSSQALLTTGWQRFPPLFVFVFEAFVMLLQAPQYFRCDFEQS